MRALSTWAESSAACRGSRCRPGSWSIGQPLRLTDGRTGRLTEVAPVGEGFEALAVLSLLDATAAGDADTAAGEAVAAQELPLPYRRHAAAERQG